MGDGGRRCGEGDADPQQIPRRLRPLKLQCFAAIHIAIVALLTACCAMAHAIESVTAPPSSTINSIYALPIFVAQHQGFFAKEGLSLDVIVGRPAARSG